MLSSSQDWMPCTALVFAAAPLTTEGEASALAGASPGAPMPSTGAVGSVRGALPLALHMSASQARLGWLAMAALAAWVPAAKHVIRRAFAFFRFPRPATIVATVGAVIEQGSSPSTAGG